MDQKHVEDVAKLRAEDKEIQARFREQIEEFEKPTNFIERLDAISYYIGEGGMRQVDIVDAFGLDYDEGSALKYLIRRGIRNNMTGDQPQRRNTQGDLEKAIWHLNRKLSKL